MMREIKKKDTEKKANENHVDWHKYKQRGDIAPRKQPIASAVTKSICRPTVAKSPPEINSTHFLFEVE